MTSRPPVTCHVLDTTTGRPAKDILCSLYKLELVKQKSLDGWEEITESNNASLEPFAMARTNADGRIPHWIFNPDPSKRGLLNDLGIQQKESNELQWEELMQGTYKIRFQVGKYYEAMQQKNFHPFVEIVFNVEDTRHYHIPLLLSNYGYTTYRGS